MSQPWIKTTDGNFVNVNHCIRAEYLPIPNKWRLHLVDGSSALASIITHPNEDDDLELTTLETAIGLEGD